MSGPVAVKPADAACALVTITEAAAAFGEEITRTTHQDAPPPTDDTPNYYCQYLGAEPTARFAAVSFAPYRSSTLELLAKGGEEKLSGVGDVASYHVMLKTVFMLKNGFLYGVSGNNRDALIAMAKVAATRM